MAALRTDVLLLLILIVSIMRWYDQSGVRGWWADFRHMWPKRKLRALQWWRRTRKRILRRD